MTVIISAEIDQFMIFGISINVYIPHYFRHIFIKIDHGRIFISKELYNLVSLTSLRISSQNKMSYKVINFRNLQIVVINSINKLHSNLCQLPKLQMYVLNIFNIDNCGSSRYFGFIDKLNLLVKKYS